MEFVSSAALSPVIWQKTAECSWSAQCDSDHLVPPTQGSARSTPPPNNGGEKEHTGTSVAVNSQCTQVCGPVLTGRSCSKICLVRVYYQGQPEKAVNMFAILDDESNRSLVRSGFFKLFSIKSQLFPYKLKTCAGPVDTSGHKAEHFQI